MVKYKLTGIFSIIYQYLSHYTVRIINFCQCLIRKEYISSHINNMPERYGEGLLNIIDDNNVNLSFNGFKTLRICLRRGYDGLQ